jgi:hypothetical protein
LEESIQVRPILDHIVWATNAPKADCDWFEQTTDVRPVPGGSHPGFGTRNDLMGLVGDKIYLELLSPDADQEPAGTLGEGLQALERGGLFHWAARHSDPENIHARAQEIGLDSSGVIPLSRRHPDGFLLEWKLVILSGHDHGGLLPFFIDWGDCPHPSGDLPSAGELTRFELVTPEEDQLRAILQALELDIEVKRGTEPAIIVELSNRGGKLKLPMSRPVLEGFAF